MSENITHILKANEQYAKDFDDRSGLSNSPKRRLAVLTCMDARIDPLRFLGLDLGDANIIRTGGGRASEDAIRSLVAAKTFLGTNEWIVIHHTECGFETFTQEEIGKILKDRFDTAEGDFINWLTISDRVQSVKDDVQHIRNHPLVSKDIKISGYLVNTVTGKLTEVVSPE